MRAMIVAALLVAGAAAARAQTPTPEASLAQELTNCAGAVASAGGFDVVHFTTAEGEWGAALEAILARLAREPGVEGMTGRYAASAARAHWDDQAEQQRHQEAARCQARFAGA